MMWEDLQHRWLLRGVQMRRLDPAVSSALLGRWFDSPGFPSAEICGPPARVPMIRGPDFPVSDASSLTSSQ